MQTFEQYEKEALRTNPHERGDRDALINFAFGLMGEAGEVVDHLKKHLFHNDTSWEWEQKLILELGDLLWYITMVADQFSVNMETVAAMNVAKLRQRYPNGFVANRGTGEYIPTPEEINAIRDELRTDAYIIEPDDDDVPVDDVDDVEEDELSYYRDDVDDVAVGGGDVTIYDSPYPVEEDYWETR